jgi:hypothetical protein
LDTLEKVSPTDSQVQFLLAMVEMQDKQRVQVGFTRNF